RFAQNGYITFDGLLARARDLLRDNLTIRQELKRQFRALLVDEFQDTDPLQYELILYLAESLGNTSKDWRTVRLEPGKLFIVGDPKQSIYAFRGADMEAYDTVVKDRIIAQTPAAESYTLQTNFRSHPKLLATLNAFFSRVFPEKPIRGIQPRHEPLQAFESDSSPLPSERVELRLVRPREPETDIEAATRMEAEELARWLSEEVFGRQEILDLGARVKVRPKHVAILLRTFTKARDYLEALRRHDIPCLTDGEKHFYERQEIIDVVNVVCLVANPLDRVALVGVLRSAFGGVPDTDLEALARANLLDYRYEAAELEHSRQVRSADRVAPVYAVLRELHRLMPRLPLDEAIHLLFARLPLLELAAASIDHEQAVANLMKLRNILSQLAQQGDLSFQGLVTEMVKRVSEPPDEPECSLVEETLEETEQIGAVRLLSVHKAKGLEFPVVILAGLHQRSGHSEPRIMAQHDWSSGLVGVRVGELQTVGGIYVRDKLAVRQRAEQKRILYVAMTRAKRRLILSAGLPGEKSRNEESALAHIGSVLGIDPFATEQAIISVGEGEVMIDVVTVPDGRRSVPRADATWREVADDPRELQKRWSDRSKRWEDAEHTVLYTTPSELSTSNRTRSRGIPPPSRRHADGEERTMAGLIGTLAHRVLEGWDYAEDPERLQTRIASICHHAVPPEWAHHADRIQAELCEILGVFSVSAPYAELRRATVIQREMPFIMPWSGSLSGASISPREGCAMEGVIDIVYRINGNVWVADYKTDFVSDEEIPQRAAAYEPQARVYKAAVARGLGLEQVRFQFLFLRNGVAVPV
ncbi:MAG: UvrD-helicase domain-containing protein, partial [Nitrospiraceae bacterium]